MHGSDEPDTRRRRAPDLRSAPAITADRQAYGIRLHLVSANSYDGAVEFVPPQTATYQIYMSSPNAGVRVLVPGGNGQAMTSSCSSSVTSTECSVLRRVDSLTLIGGQHYRIEIGTTTTNYIRLFIQTRDPVAAVCEADELTSVELACTTAAAGDEVIAASPIGQNPVNQFQVDHVYGLQLSPDGLGNYGGGVSFRPPFDGEYELYLGTPNIPVQVTEFFSRATVAATCSRYIGASECNLLRRGTRLTLHSDRPYRFDFGPIHANSYVRATLRRVAEPTRIKLAFSARYAADPAEAAPVRLNHGDLDNDGHVDLVWSIADENFQPHVAVLRNDGAGTFTSVNELRWGLADANVIADFNGDGNLDMIGTAWDGMGPIDGYYFTGNGDFTFTRAGWSSNGLTYLSFIAGADFDEDGVTDVVVPWDDWETSLGSGFAINLLPSFTQTHVETIPEFGAFTRHAIAGDFNGDGHQDVVASDDTRGQLYLGDGTGHVVASGPMFPVSAERLYAADFNGDGISDLVAAAPSPAIYYGSPTGLTAAQQLTTSLIATSGAASGDFDHDGFVDLLIPGADSSSTGAIAVVFGSATGLTSGTATILVPNATFACDPTVADFDGDGFDDVAVGCGGANVFLSTP